MSGLRVLVCGVLLLLALCLDVVDAECKAGIKNKAGTRLKPAFGMMGVKPFDPLKCRPIPKNLKCYVEVEDPEGCVADVAGDGSLTSSCTVKSWIVRNGAPCSLSDFRLLGVTREPVAGTFDSEECEKVKKKGGMKYDLSVKSNKFKIFTPDCEDPQAHCYVEVKDPANCDVTVDKATGEAVASCDKVNFWRIYNDRPCAVERIPVSYSATSFNDNAKSDAPLNDVSTASFLCLLAVAFFGLFFL